MNSLEHLASIGYSVEIKSDGENYATGKTIIKLTATGSKGKYGLAYDAEIIGGFDRAIVGLHNCILDAEGLTSDANNLLPSQTV